MQCQGRTQGSAYAHDNVVDKKIEEIIGSGSNDMVQV